MAEVIGITPEQLQEIMQKSISAAVRAAREPNPVEQKQLDDMVQREKRRTSMMLSLGQIEEEARERKKHSCSHSRWPMSAGKRAGHAAPSNAPGSEWTTGGQAIGGAEEKVILICQRCGTTWCWKMNEEEKSFVRAGGDISGWAPASADRLIQL